MIGSVKSKNLRRLVLLFIFFTYASLSVAECKQDLIYIKPTISELQASTSAAGKGGMLSSAWHEATLKLSCTGMIGGSGAVYIYRYYMRPAYAGSGMAFEGQSYPLWLTGNPDVLMIASIAPPNGDFSPITTNSYAYTLSIPNPDANGNIQEGVRVRVRYFSKNSNLTAGAKVLNELPLLVGNIEGRNVNCNSPGGATESECWGRVSPVSVSPLSFNVNSVSCALDVPSLVKMRTLDLTSLSSVGATAEGASFQLGVSCNRAPVSYRVYYSMIDVNNPANTSSNLTLAALAGQASGVALRVLDNGQPVSFGLDGSLKPIGIMGITGGTQTKTLSVGYVRTRDVVSPGKVGAGVSVTLSYD